MSLTDAPALGDDTQWGEHTIRRMLRLLASHSPNISDPAGRDHALHLLWDVLRRRGIPVELVETEDTPSLLICGHGPTLIVVHLDDIRPTAQVTHGQPPNIIGGVVHGPGVVRKAAVLAAIGLLASDRDGAEQITLAIETDRYAGSCALDAWLNGPAADRHFNWAFCESSDLPIPAPAIFRGATGRLSMTLTIGDDSPLVDTTYSGVVSDPGHELAHALMSLKSINGEVMIPAFYDDVTVPDPDEIMNLNKVAPYVSGWLSRGQVRSGEQLPPSHVTLGAFLAPSLTVQSIVVDDAHPWLPRSALAAVDVRIMPGQTVSMIAANTEALLRRHSPRVKVSVTAAQPAAQGRLPGRASESTTHRVIPVAPGPSPAGIIEASRIPVTGFSTVWQDPSEIDERIPLTAIEVGTSFLRSLCLSANNSHVARLS